MCTHTEVVTGVSDRATSADDSTVLPNSIFQIEGVLKPYIPLLVVSKEYQYLRNIYRYLSHMYISIFLLESFSLEHQYEISVKINNAEKKSTVIHFFF